MHVTVCICTRNRGESIAGTLRSVLDVRYRDFDVLIVDQSSDDSTERTVRRVADGNPQVTYMSSQTSGLSRARNICVRHARGPLVAFTDDDCDIPPDWLDLLVERFGEQPRVGQVCGAVIPGPHDATRGFIPDYPISTMRLITSPWRKWREGGIGANMAFRLDALRNVGPFDEVLGAGGLLHTCEDGDMTYRVLKAGYHVLELPEAYVIHRGFRTWEQGRTMMRLVGVGVGAAYMKHLRLRDHAVLPTLMIEWARCISWARLLLLRRHSGIGRFVGYARGMARSFGFRIDPQLHVYVDMSDEGEGRMDTDMLLVSRTQHGLQD
jgi:glycosyltransferase involved in cell wall biosynthesis